MKAMTAKRRASTNRLHALRRLLNKRCDGACERCGFPLDILDNGDYLFDLHHRQRRTQGGRDVLSNVAAIHAGCHTITSKSVHQDVRVATEEGWLVPAYQSPANVPLLYRGLWAQMDDEGAVTYLDPRSVWEVPNA